MFFSIAGRAAHPIIYIIAQVGNNSAKQHKGHLVNGFEVKPFRFNGLVERCLTSIGSCSDKLIVGASITT